MFSASLFLHNNTKQEQSCFAFLKKTRKWMHTLSGTSPSLHLRSQWKKRQDSVDLNLKVHPLLLNVQCMQPSFFFFRVELSLNLILQKKKKKRPHLVSIFSRWSRRTSRSRKTYRSLNTISSSWTLRSFFTLQYFLLDSIFQTCTWIRFLRVFIFLSPVHPSLQKGLEDPVGQDVQEVQ